MVTKLAPYKDYLSERIKSAHPVSLPGTVLFQEIKELGLHRRGGIGDDTQLRDYLRSIKPAAKQEDIIRFEAASGKQMQS